MPLFSWSRFEHRYDVAHRDRGSRRGVARCIKASWFLRGTMRHTHGIRFALGIGVIRHFGK
jgi:hypothetical protein